MEYTFISRNTLDQIVEKYDTSLYDKNLRSWAKDKFILEEIVLGDYRVLVKATNNPVLIVEKFYEVLCHTHGEITQHSGQRQTWNSIHERWGYIKQLIVEEFMNNCTACATRRLAFHPLAAKPIIVKNFLSRMQMDLIDFSYIPDGEFKYMCHIRDHFSRFSWAKALTSKRPIKVASFLTSYQGINRAMAISKDNKRVPKAPQSQGLVERANGILEQRLGKWRETTGRDNWLFGLRFVVVAMNNSWCRSHKKTPYELVYEDKSRGNCTLVNELYTNNIFNKEEIPDTIEISDANYKIDLDDNMIDFSLDNINDQEQSPDALADITSNLNSERHEMLRDTARRNLQQYTDKMMQQMLKKRKVVDFKVGDFIRVNIPKIDRFSIDRPTLPCKILEKIDDRYRLGCKFGVINICYSSGEIEALGTTTYAELSKIPSNQISIREAARLQSVGM
ncbi:8719_t:CDS:2, partial [Gigaspora rosea]